MTDEKSNRVKQLEKLDAEIKAELAKVDPATKGCFETIIFDVNAKECQICEHFEKCRAHDEKSRLEELEQLDDEIEAEIEAENEEVVQEVIEEAAEIPPELLTEEEAVEIEKKIDVAATPHVEIDQIVTVVGQRGKKRCEMYMKVFETHEDHYVIGDKTGKEPKKYRFNFDDKKLMSMNTKRKVTVLTECEVY